MRKRHDYGEQDKSHRHMEGVQADQRIVGSPEQIRADRQSVLIDHPIPFPRRSEEERSTQSDGAEPPVSETSDSAIANCFDREVNGQAAGKQTDRIKDRDPENVPRRRSGQTLANVEEVRNHEDYENRRLGGDQAEHPDSSALGQFPGEIRAGRCDRVAVIPASITRISNPGLPDA